MDMRMALGRQVEADGKVKLDIADKLEQAIEKKMSNQEIDKLLEAEESAQTDEDRAEVYRTIRKSPLQYPEIARKLREDGEAEFDCGRIHRLMCAMYAESVLKGGSETEKYFEFFDAGLDEKAQADFKHMKQIGYINQTPMEHLKSLYRFGHIISKYIKIREDDGSGGDGGEGKEGKGKEKEGEGQGKQRGDGKSKGINIGDCGLEDIPDEVLDGALSKILGHKDLGPNWFKKALAYIKKRKPGFRDSFDTPSESSKMAGLERADPHRNDDLIPLYKRWDTVPGPHIVQRPIEKDDTANYLGQRKEYEVGDPIERTDVFGSMGMIGIPGVSKIRELEEGVMPSKSFRIPHVNIGIDSSGSMKHPRDRYGCVQVRAGFKIARTYHANEAYVGAWNFSADLIYIPPTRDIEAVYSNMLLYFGGGTVLNVEKLREFIENSKFSERFDPRMARFTSEEDYKRFALSHFSEEERRRLGIETKNLHVKTPEERRQYEKLDNVLISDGFIANPEDVIRHLTEMGEITRNFVFITDATGYEKWKDVNAPGTWVYPAFTEDALMGLAMGRAKALVEEAKTNYIA